MDFDFSEEQAVLRRECGRLLTKHSALERVRQVFEGEEAFDRPLWKTMAEHGWLGVAIPEEYGGSGMGKLEQAVIAEEIGRALAAVPHSSSIYLVANALLLAGSEAQKQRYLPGIAGGELIGCFAAQETWRQPDFHSGAMVLEKGTLSGIKSPVLDGDIAHLAVVTCLEDGELTLALADLRDERVSRQALQSFDPSRSQCLLRFDALPAERLGNPADGSRLIDRLLDGAGVLTAFEQLGGGQRCLELARDHVLQRHAFGRPVGSYQAIKHKLADIYVDLELARSNAYYGIWALESSSPELPVAAAVARISATEAFSRAAEESLHLHGGVGFTWEYDCHLFLRRAKLLSLWVGSSRLWKSRLVSKLREGLAH